MSRELTKETESGREGELTPFLLATFFFFFLKPLEWVDLRPVFVWASERNYQDPFQSRLVILTRQLCAS